jgi:hypothetical protein
MKRSFDGARKAADLSDVRFHDLRHTAATRLVGGHIPLPEVGRILGHTQANTTFRYENANQETAKRAAAALNAFHRYEPETEQVVVNFPSSPLTEDATLAPRGERTLVVVKLTDRFILLFCSLRRRASPRACPTRLAA